MTPEEGRAIAEASLEVRQRSLGLVTLSRVLRARANAIRYENAHLRRALNQLVLRPRRPSRRKAE